MGQYVRDQAPTLKEQALEEEIRKIRKFVNRLAAEVKFKMRNHFRNNPAMPTSGPNYTTYGYAARGHTETPAPKWKGKKRRPMNNNNPRPDDGNEPGQRPWNRSGKRWNKPGQYEEPNLSQRKAAEKIALHVNLGYTEQGPTNPATIRLAMQAPARMRAMMKKESAFELFGILAAQ